MPIVNIKWWVEPDNVEIVDAQYRELPTEQETTSDFDHGYYDALASNLMNEKPSKVRRSADFEEFVSSDKHVNLIPVFLVIVFVVAGGLSMFLWFLGG
jgi:hypothetical protein